MWLFKEFSLLVFLEICVVLTWSYKVDTKKQVSSQVSFKDEHDSVGSSKAQEHFNPGHAQHGGWHKPDDLVHRESSVSDNQWHVNDNGGFSSGQDVSRLSDEQGGSFKVGQTVGFPGSGSQSEEKFSSFSGGSLNHGGDLIVGQGSVQRPANLGSQYQPSSNFGQGVGSFPVQAHIAPGASQFSQVISSGSKKPSYSVSEHPEYASQSAGAGISAYRPSPPKPVQHQQKPGAYNGQGGHPNYPLMPVIGQGSQFPTHSAPGRPPIYSTTGGLKPQHYKPKPVESHHSQGGNRFPAHLGPFGGNSGLRNGPKNPLPKSPTKYQSVASQPVHHFAQPPNSSGVKYFHQ